MMKAAPEEVHIHDNNNVIEFEPPLSSRRETAAKKPPAGGDVVVIPNFSRKAIKKKIAPPPPPPPPPDQEIGCLELPTKAREIMRQVSGLGMEDPVFGSNHTFTRQAAAKNFPYFNLFDDMKLTDFPEDMKDMLSVCSDPTASLHNESWSSFHSKKDGLPSNNKNNRVGRMLSSSQAVHSPHTKKEYPSPGLDLEIDFSRHGQQQAPPPPARRQTFRHPFIPPQSNRSLVREEMEEGKGIDQTTFSKRTSAHMAKEKPSDRRWRKSTIAERLYHHKQDTATAKKSSQDDDDDDVVQVIIPSFPSKKKKNTRTDRFYQSEQTLNYDHHLHQQQQQPTTAVGDRWQESRGGEEELLLEDLFPAGKVKQPMRKASNHNHRKPSKLSASDSNLFYNVDLDMKCHGPMEGLELNVRSDGSRISALTMETLQNTTTQSSISERRGRRSVPREPVIPEENIEDLQKSLDLCDLQMGDEEDENASASTHSSCRDVVPKQLGGPTTKKEKTKKKSHNKPSSEVTLSRKESKDRKSSRVKTKASGDARGRSSTPSRDREQLQHVEEDPPASSNRWDVASGLKKFYASSSDWAGPSAFQSPFSPEKGKGTKSRRSHSLEGKSSHSKQQDSSNNAVHRRGPSKKGGTPQKSHTYNIGDTVDTAARMLAFGNASSKAADRAMEIRSKFARYKDRAIEIAGRSSSNKKGRKSRTGSGNKRPASDNLHASMNITANDDDKVDAEQLAAGHQSFGILDFDLS